MATIAINPIEQTRELRQQAHELIDRMAASQVSALVGLINTLLDPVSRAIANAPYDDEPVSKAEAREIAAARASFARGEVISHEEVLSDFGLSMEDWERMERTPLETIAPGQ
jgi:hypothetical protein